MSDSSEISVPRLARLVKGSQGYGFNLHGDKTQPGQTISAVDKDSPAEIGGLREGDRLIEVNGSNVEDMSHGDVVKKIKENPNETTLLVCDKVTLAYLKNNNRSCTADMANLSTVFVKTEEEPASVIANGDATPEVVTEKIEESAPVAVEESAPPPAPVTKEEAEPEPAPAPEPSGPTPDEAEAVQGIDRVVDEQEEEKPAEVPVVEPEPPKPEEPAAPKVEEPAKAPEPAPVKTSSESDGLLLDIEKARALKNSRKAAKQTGQAWGDKISVLNSL